MISRNIYSFVYVIALVFFLSLPVLAEVGVVKARLEKK
jgi:hypothetical protein